jgi:IclR family mhp operon transcriptional activator
VQTLSSGYQEDGRLIDAARPHIMALNDRHGWPVTVATHVGFRMMIADSTHALTSLTFSHYYPGYTLPLLECAAGRAYLSFTTEEERKLILETLKRIPDITNSHALQLFETNELTEIIVRDGYAAMGHNRFTQDPGKTSSIAVPLYNGDQIVGALALIFFFGAQRLDHAVPRYLSDLRETAGAIKASLAEAVNVSSEGSWNRSETVVEPLFPWRRDQFVGHATCVTLAGQGCGSRGSGDTIRRSPRATPTRLTQRLRMLDEGSLAFVRDQHWRG